MAYVANIEQVSEEDFSKGDAKSTKVKYLIDQRHGAKNFYLRMYEVKPGGQTPLDQHPYEHEVYVLNGAAKLLSAVNNVPTEREVREGDVVFIASGQVHQFVNERQETFRMLCVRGAGRPSGQADADLAEGIC